MGNRGKTTDIDNSHLNRPEIMAERHHWFKANRGITVRIAQECGLSRAMVSRIANGHRKSFDGLVERALREAGCPGWEQRKGAKRA